MSTVNRRDFLRSFAGAAAVAAFSQACGGGLESDSAAPPNLIVIMADDMGFSDIGSYGGEISTPVLDRLAGNGLRFRHFYNTARCCPARASLLTGLYPHQTGVGHMMGDYGLRGYRGDLNDECVTIAEVLKPAGYTTLMSGKWHVTPAVDPDEEEPSNHNWPLQRGFDRFYGTIHGAGSFYDPVTLTLDNEPIKPEGEDYYYTTAIGEYAAKFIEEAPREKPFFLYMPFTAPHWPLHAPEEDVAKYNGRYDMGWDALREERHQRMKGMGVVKADWPLTPRDESVSAWEDTEHKEWQARRMEVYAAQVETMDTAIGRMVETLERTGEFENTLILFLADNGGCAQELSEHIHGLHVPTRTRDGRPVQRGNDPNTMPGSDDDYQSYGVPWANASNTPFRLYKQWVHEGGIASPLIAHWPKGLTVPGQWTDEPSHLIDLMATCADLGGAAYPETFNGNRITPLEGRSLAPLFRGQPRESHEAIYWEHEGNRAIRQGKWKLVSKWLPPENDEWELYDMEADRTEMNNLAAALPEKVEELSGMWQAWADRSHVAPWKSWE